MQARCLHAGFYPGSGPRTARDLCPSGYYNSLALCPEELECSDDRNCSSEDVCCPNSCGTNTCVAPWIREEITEDQSLCRNVTCPGQGRQCLVFNERTWCMCVRECEHISHNRDLICDQNGTTYLSRCLLEKRACESGRQLIPTRCASLRGNTRDEAEEISGPSFNSITADHTVEVGDTVQLICRPNGNPRPTIHWQHPVGNMYAVDPRLFRQNDRIFIDSDGTLTVKNVAMSDKGKYLCFANSKVGLAIKSVFLTVQASRNNMRSGRSSTSSRVDCSTFPIRQADRCGTTRDITIKHMWVYNKSKNNCEKQHFRDCFAVTNKFETEEECSAACVKDVCALPAEKGPCRIFETRIAYDPERGFCRAFVYGGCGGNSNNFRDIHECVRICANGSHRGPIIPRRCERCKKHIPQAVCASDFVIVASIKRFHPDSLKKTGTGYLLVEVKEVLVDRSTDLNLRRLNLRNSREARMHIRINLDASCPCPRIADIHPAVRSAGSRHHRSGRSSDISAIIAGNVVNRFPTLTSQGLAQRKTTDSYARVVSSVNYPSLCREILRLGG